MTVPMWLKVGAAAGLGAHFGELAAASLGWSEFVGGVSGLTLAIWLTVTVGERHED